MLVAHNPDESAKVELGRLMDTLDDMGGRKRIECDGVGDIDPVRMQAGLDLTVSLRQLPRKPALGEVFDRSLLPEVAERRPCM